MARFTPSLRTAGKFGAIAAAAAAITLAAAAPASAAPALTVDPATGLSDGQTVTVSGSGYTPGTQVGIVECDLDISADVACALDTFVAVTVGDDGSVTGSFTVKKAFTGVDPASGTARAVDCAVASCGIGTVQLDDPASGVATTAITFASASQE